MFKLKVNRTVTFLVGVTVTFGSCISTAESTDAVTIGNPTQRLSIPQSLSKRGPDTILVYRENGTLKEKLTYYPGADDTLYTPKYLNAIKGYPLSDTIYGNFNGDNIYDTAWFMANLDTYNNCEATLKEKPCKGVVAFSDSSIPPLVIEYCPFGFPKNEGDLNGDGVDEIGVQPGWFSSACRSYYVFTFKKKGWVEACDPIPNSLNMREAGIVLIEKDPDRKGYAIIRSSYENSRWCSCQGCSVLERSVLLK